MPAERAGPLKRPANIDAYFTPLKKHAGTSAASAKPSQQVVQGLSITDDLISQDEEGLLLTFLDSESWRTDLSRRTIHYGGTYCLMPPANASPEERERISKQIFKAKDIPQELGWLVERMITQGLYDQNAPPRYCIVNEYLPGHGISAHVENFRFDEPVCSLTLNCGDMMRFHELSAAHDGSVRTFEAAKAPRTGRRKDVWLPPRSLLVLKGDARYRWQHEIVRGRKQEKGWRRVSLTFRVEK